MYVMRDQLIKVALKETYGDGVALYEREVLARPATPAGRAELEAEIARLKAQPK